MLASAGRDLLIVWDALGDGRSRTLVTGAHDTTAVVWDVSK